MDWYFWFVINVINIISFKVRFLRFKDLCGVKVLRYDKISDVFYIDWYLGIYGLVLNIVLRKWLINGWEFIVLFLFKWMMDDRV